MVIFSHLAHWDVEHVAQSLQAFAYLFELFVHIFYFFYLFTFILLLLLNHG